MRQYKFIHTAIFTALYIKGSAAIPNHVDGSRNHFTAKTEV